MMKVTLAALMLVFGLAIESSAEASDCAQVAGKAARAIDAISNNQALGKIAVKYSERIGRGNKIF